MGLAGYSWATLRPLSGTICFIVGILSMLPEQIFACEGRHLQLSVQPHMLSSPLPFLHAHHNAGQKRNILSISDVSVQNATVVFKP